MVSPRSGLVIVCAALAMGSFALVQVSGCSSSDNGGSPTPPGDDGSTDSTPAPDSGAPPDSGTPPPACGTGGLAALTWTDDAGDHDPDFSCYGDNDAGPVPDAGDGGPVPSTFQLIDFQSRQPVVGATVDLFYGNTVANGAAPDETHTTLAGDDAGIIPAGSFSFTPQNGVFAYRVNTSATEHQLIQFDNVPPAKGGTFMGNAIAESSYELLLTGAIGMTSTAPGTSVIVAAVRDCASHNLQNSTVTLVDGQGNVVPVGTTASSLHELYFGPTGIPDSRLKATTTFAVWAAVNVAQGDVTLQLGGCVGAAATAPTTFSTHKVELVPDAIVVPRPYSVSP